VRNDGLLVKWACLFDLLFVLVNELLARPIIDAESKLVLPGPGLLIGCANRSGLVLAVLATEMVQPIKGLIAIASIVVSILLTS
jgi:hypothetical protein